MTMMKDDDDDGDVDDDDDDDDDAGDGGNGDDDDGNDAGGDDDDAADDSTDLVDDDDDDNDDGLVQGVDAFCKATSSLSIQAYCRDQLQAMLCSSGVKGTWRCKLIAGIRRQPCSAAAALEEIGDPRFLRSG